MHGKILGAAAALGLLVGQADAKPLPAHPDPFLSQFLELFDANKDGKVTRAEFDRGSDYQFFRLDRNQDGIVTKEELNAAKPHKLKPGEIPPAPSIPPPPG
jgi:hypothetical protein